MAFRGSVTIFSAAPDTVDFLQAWDIDDAELNDVMRKSLAAISESQVGLKDVASRAAWSGYALVEFQDLQPIYLPKEGSFLNQNFLFYEALAGLRESVLCGLGGMVHASLAVLRSVIEQFVFHYWWRERLKAEDTFDRFYDWLTGKRGPAPFANVARHLCRDRGYLWAGPEKTRIEEVYDLLCSYSHKPIFYESVTARRGGNYPIVNPELLHYWLNIVTAVEQALLHLAVTADPHILFTLDPYRKFGFNLPIGAFLDTYSTSVVHRALGDISIQDLRRVLSEGARHRLVWFESLPDLSEAEILSSFTGKISADEDLPFEERLLRRAVVNKAKMRLTALAFAYVSAPHSISRGEREAIFETLVPHGRDQDEAPKTTAAADI